MLLPLRDSADLGYAAAQLCLGYAYLTGQGIAADSANAYQWIFLAAQRDPKNQDYQARLARVKAVIREPPVARGQSLAQVWLDKFAQGQ